MSHLLKEDMKFSPNESVEEIVEKLMDEEYVVMLAKEYTFKTIYNINLWQLKRDDVIFMHKDEFEQIREKRIIVYFHPEI